MTPFLHESSPEQARERGLFQLVLPMDLLTPVRAFLSLRGSGHRGCLLESAEGPTGLAAWSFIGVDPNATFRADGDACSLSVGEGAAERFTATPIEGLRRAAARLPAHAADPELPPLAGGWIGYLGYDLARVLEPRVPDHPSVDRPRPPTAHFEFFGDVVAFDHVRQRVHVLTDCAVTEVADDPVAAARERAVKIAFDLYGEPAIPGPVTLSDDGPSSVMSEDAYRAGVASLREAIGQGEIFQAVLARRLERRIAGDAFTLYRALRIANPAPHMFYFESPEVTLVGSSPERLVSVRGSTIETRPIAGTRPRGRDGAEDDALGVELQRDPKERAEHDMLVDLARNDVGRVARIGSVRVRRYQSLEKFTRVQHLVSIVEGDLRADRDALDALAACFPAGTVSGAPKIRAMELIAALEPEPRGPYAGAFGYLDRMGNLDTAIILRTILVEGDRVSVESGAGIVFASDPTAELRETEHKARALLECVELAASPVFGPPGE